MDGKNSENKIKVGKGQGTGEGAKGYENLDALVFDATNKIIAEEYADDTELVVICGRNILADKYFQNDQQNQPAYRRIGRAGDFVAKTDWRLESDPCAVFPGEFNVDYTTSIISPFTCKRALCVVPLSTIRNATALKTLSVKILISLWKIMIVRH